LFIVCYWKSNYKITEFNLINYFNFISSYNKIYNEKYHYVINVYSVKVWCVAGSYFASACRSSRHLFDFSRA